MAPIVVYYNKDIFNELEVEIPKTVDELEEIMVKAKEAGYIPTGVPGGLSSDFVDGTIYGIERSSQGRGG